jgi:hypothetical protein
MRHAPAAGAVVLMFRGLKIYGMAQRRHRFDLTGRPSFRDRRAFAIGVAQSRDGGTLGTV